MAILKNVWVDSQGNTPMTNPAYAPASNTFCKLLGLFYVLTKLHCHHIILSDSTFIIVIFFLFSSEQAFCDSMFMASQWKWSAVLWQTTQNHILVWLLMPYLPWLDNLSTPVPACGHIQTTYWIRRKRWTLSTNHCNFTQDHSFKRWGHIIYLYFVRMEF